MNTWVILFATILLQQLQYFFLGPAMYSRKWSHADGLPTFVKVLVHPDAQFLVASPFRPAVGRPFILLQHDVDEPNISQYRFELLNVLIRTTNNAQGILNQVACFHECMVRLQGSVVREGYQVDLVEFQIATRIKIATLLSA